MAVPAFFGALTLIHSPLDTWAKAWIGAGIEEGAEHLGFCLDVKMPRREQPEWCWAATTVSVANLMNPAKGWTQCRVASECLTMPCCPPTAACNYQYALDRALRKTGNLAAAPIDRALSFDEIVREVGNYRPVCCHIKWSGNNNGHFNVIAGYVSATQDIIVRDSAFEEDQVLPYVNFRDRFKNAGIWDYSYLTTKAR